MTESVSSSPASAGPQAARMKPAMLGIYRRMLAIIFVATLVMIAALSALVYWASDLTLLFVVLSGGLGAVFSMLTRLYSLRDLPGLLDEPGFELKGIHLLMYTLAPILVGMIGAIFFHACVAANLITGDLFQHFKQCDSSAAGIQRLLDCPPDTAADYAKCLVWGFVSGFSERLVPDQLRHLEARD